MIFTHGYTGIIPLLLGFALDLLLGDPLWLPHPIRFFGNTITFFEKKLNNGRHRILKGAVLAMLLMGGTWLVLFMGIHWLISYPHLFYPIATLLVFYGLANRSLIAEALKVNRKLKHEGLEAARKQLSFIVGRETSGLSENKVRIAVLETVAENLSDGVIAPLCYYAIGGIPLMFTYKMVNTLDSMIGYKNERFRYFALFAARMDDVFNYIPARLTALLMVLITASGRGFSFILKYGNKHSSPNSGFPEAALAGILNCRFGGPNVYGGKIVDKPFIGNNERVITHADIRQACFINILVTFVLVAILCVIWNLGFHKA